MKRFSPLFLLIPLILLAGCAAPPFHRPSGEEGSGGVVTGLGRETGVSIPKIKVSKLIEGEEGYLTVTISNIGEAEAKNVKAELILPSDWEIPERVIEIGTLEASQPAYNKPGGIAQASWTFKVPEKVGDQSIEIKLTYSYETEAKFYVSVYSHELYKLKLYKNEPIEDKAVNKSYEPSNVPIQVEAYRFGTDLPFIYKKDRTNVGTIFIKLTNVGKGFPYLASIGDMSVYVKADVRGEVCVNKPVKFTENTKEIQCKFTIPATDYKEKIPLKVELSYNYLVKIPYTLTISPKLE